MVIFWAGEITPKLNPYAIRCSVNLYCKAVHMFEYEANSVFTYLYDVMEVNHSFEVRSRMNEKP